jgi:hypothetical protein
MEGLKRCVTCKEWLPPSAFNKRRLSEDGLQFRCRECFRQWHAENKERHNAQIQGRVDRLRSQHNEKLRAYLENSACSDCGEQNIRVLEFDHVRGQKLNDIAMLIRQAYPWEIIEAEFAKCEVVCANCHRRRTYLREGSVRAQWVPPSRSD